MNIIFSKKKIHRHALVASERASEVRRSRPCSLYSIIICIHPAASLSLSLPASLLTDWQPACCIVAMCPLGEGRGGEGRAFRVNACLSQDRCYNNKRWYSSEQRLANAASCRFSLLLHTFSEHTFPSALITQPTPWAFVCAAPVWIRTQP